MNESRVRPGIQFMCGSFSSRVSSRDMTFALGGMNKDTAFSDEVLPEAVPPEKMSVLLFSMQSHRYAISSVENVFHAIRSIGVMGTSLNLRMVNVLPRVVISLPSVIWIREPSGIVASIIGSAMDICLPQRCASRITNESSCFSVNMMFVMMFS